MLVALWDYVATVASGRKNISGGVTLFRAKFDFLKSRDPTVITEAGGWRSEGKSCPEKLSFLVKCSG